MAEPHDQSMLDRALTYTTFPGKRPGQVVLQLVGPVTVGNLAGFRENLRSLKPLTLLVEMTQVPYMDSAGLGLLLNYYVSAQRSGRHLVLIGVSERVMTLFEVTRIDAILTMFPTLPAAFASLLY